jgi:hypothetical protein
MNYRLPPFLLMDRLVLLQCHPDLGALSPLEPPRHSLFANVTNESVDESVDFTHNRQCTHRELTITSHKPTYEE